jgi:hypothetical protein
MFSLSSINTIQMNINIAIPVHIVSPGWVLVFLQPLMTLLVRCHNCKPSNSWRSSMQIDTRALRSCHGLIFDWQQHHRDID